MVKAGRSGNNSSESKGEDLSNSNMLQPCKGNIS